MKIQRNLLAMMALLTTFSGCSWLRADHAPAVVAGENSLPLSDTLKQLLQQEMRAVQQGMQQLVPAISSGAWSDVAFIGRKIQGSYILKQQLSAEQKHALHQALPDEFIRLDHSFHQSAGMLAHAAEMHNADVVSFYYYKLTDACVQCHSRYAGYRFPGLAVPQQDKHDH